jgi:hypothetical protein
MSIVATSSIFQEKSMLYSEAYTYNNNMMNRPDKLPNTNESLRTGPVAVATGNSTDDDGNGVVTVLPPPVRPSSAYNMFFRMERNRIVNTDEDLESLISIPYVFTTDEVQAYIQSQRQLHNEHAKLVLLQHNKSIVETTGPKQGEDIQVLLQLPKRKHVKTHGKIGFGDLARHIAKRWKEMPAVERTVFTTAFKMEWEYYKTSFEQWKSSNNQIALTCRWSTVPKLQQQQQRKKPKAKPCVQSRTLAASAASAASVAKDTILNKNGAVFQSNDDISISQSQQSGISSSSSFDFSDMGGISGIDIDQSKTTQVYPSSSSFSKIAPPSFLCLQQRRNMREFVTPQTSNRSIAFDPNHCNNERLKGSTDFYSDSNLLRRMRAIEDSTGMFQQPCVPFLMPSSNVTGSRVLSNTIPAMSSGSGSLSLPSRSYSNNINGVVTSKATTNLGRRYSCPPSVIAPRSVSAELPSNISPRLSGVVPTVTSIGQPTRKNDKLYNNMNDGDEEEDLQEDDNGDVDTSPNDFDGSTITMKQRQIQRIQRMQRYMKLKQHILQQELMIKKHQVVLNELELQNESLIDSISMMDDSCTINNNNNSDSINNSINDYDPTRLMNNPYLEQNQEIEDEVEDYQDEFYQQDGYGNDYNDRWNTTRNNLPLEAYQSSSMMQGGYEDIQSQVNATNDNAITQLGSTRNGSRRTTTNNSSRYMMNPDAFPPRL